MMQFPVSSGGTNVASLSNTLELRNSNGKLMVVCPPPKQQGYSPITSCEDSKNTQTIDGYKIKWFLYDNEHGIWRQSAPFEKVLSFYITKGWKVVSSGQGNWAGGQSNWAHLAKY